MMESFALGYVAVFFTVLFVGVLLLLVSCALYRFEKARDACTSAAFVCAMLAFGMLSGAMCIGSVKMFMEAR